MEKWPRRKTAAVSWRTVAAVVAMVSAAVACGGSGGATKAGDHQAAAPQRILVDTDMDTDDLFALLYILKQNRSEFELENHRISAEWAPDNINVEMHKVTVNRDVEQKKVLKVVRRTGKRAVMWPSQYGTSGAVQILVAQQQHYHPGTGQTNAAGPVSSYNYYKQSYGDSRLCDANSAVVGSTPAQDSPPPRMSGAHSAGRARPPLRATMHDSPPQGRQLWIIDKSCV